MLATAVYVIVDLAQRELRFANAGHPSPFRISRTNNSVHPFKHFDQSHGPALGLFADSVFPVGRCSLEPNDLLVLFTDGLYEVPGGAGSEEGCSRCRDRARCGTESARLGRRRAGLVIPRAAALAHQVRLASCRATRSDGDRGVHGRRIGPRRRAVDVVSPGHVPLAGLPRRGVVGGRTVGGRPAGAAPVPARAARNSGRVYDLTSDGQHAQQLMRESAATGQGAIPAVELHREGQVRRQDALSSRHAPSVDGW